jgi:hypothetical protein
MGDLMMGLALFFCVLWAVAAYDRYREAIEKAAIKAEQEKQQKKWEEEYLKPQDSSLQGANLA